MGRISSFKDPNYRLRKYHEEKEPEIEEAGEDGYENGEKPPKCSHCGFANNRT